LAQENPLMVVVDKTDSVAGARTRIHDFLSGDLVIIGIIALHWRPFFPTSIALETLLCGLHLLRSLFRIRFVVLSHEPGSHTRIRDIWKAQTTAPATRG
jgi:hypothetical protein